MTAAPSRAGGAALWPVLEEREIGAQRADHLYRIYLDGFGPLRTEAAARQVLHPHEFAEEMADPRLVKYTVWRAEDDPVVLATVTNELDAVTWISPEFFAARHPVQAERGAIFYLGIALVAPGRGQPLLTERVLRELIRPVAQAKGVLAYDVCAFNNRNIRFAERAEAAIRRIAPVQISVADTQTYYQAEFL